MNPIRIIRLLLESKYKSIVMLLSLPLCLLFVTLLGLCNKQFSMYIINCSIELIALASVWLIFGALVIIWSKLKQSHPINYAMVLVLVLISIVASFPYVKDIAKGRYVYYKYGLFAMSHEDVVHMQAAINAFENREWELAKSHLDSCNKNCNHFFSYSRKKIYSELERVETSKNTFSSLIGKYELTPSMLKLYCTLAEDFGGSTLEDYLETREKVLNNINDIEKLFEAINSNELDLCVNLVSSYGLYWFEPEIQAKVLDSHDPILVLKNIVMKDDNGKQYKQNLKNVWGL